MCSMNILQEVILGFEIYSLVCDVKTEVLEENVESVIKIMLLNKEKDVHKAQSNLNFSNELYSMYM